jgi:hypothetical protein
VGLSWPGISSVSGDLPEDERPPIQAVINEFGDRLGERLDAMGAPRHTSPYFRPWGIVVVRDTQGVSVALLPSSGVPQVMWLMAHGGLMSPEVLVVSLKEQTGDVASHGVRLPLPDAADRAVQIAQAVERHLAEVARSLQFEKLNVPRSVMGLEPHIRRFLNDHPDPDKNVFVMMRFLKSDQLDEAYQTIKETLETRGYRVHRADQKDYTGELWSNVEVYLSGCNLGIAVFEEIEKRDFNPNVSLELGYMIGRGKRTLLLKEEHMPELHADVMHRLYKSWDQFKVKETVAAQVERWADIDLS